MNGQKELKSSSTYRIRARLMFWIIAPVAVSIALVTIVEGIGRFLDGSVVASSSQGIMLVAGLVPIFAAHLAFLSAVFGVVGIFLGLPSDKKFLVAIFTGLAFGSFMLHGIYFQ